ncbi:MAG: thiamine-phosphate kinase [Chloroflexi bacterium]|jgi:thiamine-monophosphate kinase|nr:thiamine-phosphate kinase [Chloroflexota bacterium]MBL17151.1 thiamine-phosphate kinase [Chloroflexota bacterium]MDP6496839.1 thiamine-phosphate kinase [Dehalococcoidia bacterium]MQG11036.1 thiamine-phosphate kinase [SAR202 cluster bacterium]MQG55622.1 thiamine-phosphate kinase [SAR202 cluster bacterium]|tara:strand:- start:47644 stop:48669 length:1026 start_codon:yes stop_codon:yes gene_type:complete
MQIKDLGEFGVIDLLTRMVVDQRASSSNGKTFSLDLSVDTGDDTAAWSAGAKAVTDLFTTDTMVEGVHFTRETTPWEDLGWKSLASNISDVASMGGLPTYALVTLGLPPETEVLDLESLYKGMLQISNEYGLAIVGGDMVRSPVVFITVALTGAMQGQPMIRTSARPGDLVAVTGHLGSSGGGLKLMLENPSERGEAADFLMRSHRRPRPAVTVGQSLVESEITTAMDVSDGMADDLSKLCRASGVSAKIFADRLPVHPILKNRFPHDSVDLALGGGEDYVLLFTGSPSKVNHVVSGLTGGAAVVGEITDGEPGKVTVVDAQGIEIPAGNRGWDHFGPAQA